MEALDSELAVREASHYVWLFLGTAPTTDPPDLGLYRRPGYTFSQRTVRVAANYRWALENSLDFSHSAYVHPWTQPSWALHALRWLPPMSATYRSTDVGLEVEGALNGHVLYQHRFVLPDRLELVILPNSRSPVELAVHHIPESARTTRMEILLGRKAWPWESASVRFFPGSLLVHRQDIVIVEAQQEAIDAGPPLTERHCAADAYTLLMRRILAAAEGDGWNPGPDLTPRSVAIRI